MVSEPLLLGFGLIGQLLFTGRFIIQWLSSERHGRSVIPAAFWHLSISGAIVLLIYAVLRHDPVFVLGQSTGLLIYLRNLQFISRQREAKLADPTSAPGSATCGVADGDCASVCSRPQPHRVA